MRVRYIKDGKFELMTGVEELDFEHDGIGVFKDGKYLDEVPFDYYTISTVVEENKPTEDIIRETLKYLNDHYDAFDEGCGGCVYDSEEEVLKGILDRINSK